MDTISKFIAISAFLFPIVLLNTLEKDIHKIESSDQIVLNVIESVLIAEDTKHNQYFDDMEYSLEIGAQNKSQKFNIQYDLSANGLNNLSQYDYFIINAKKNYKTVAHLHYDDCKSEEALIQWKDGVANKITYKHKDYLIGYNEAGLVRSLTEYKKDNRSISDVHILTYTEDEKISSVTSSITSTDLPISKEQINTKTTYNYTENKIEIAKTQYQKNKDIAASNIENVEYVTFVLDDLALTRINYRPNDKSTIDSMDETILNELGQVIRRVHTRPGQGSSIDSFEYNDLGQVLKSSTLISTTDNIISHKESLYTYSKIDTADLYKPKCDQQVSMIHSIYDEEGNLSNTFTQTTF